MSLLEQLSDSALSEWLSLSMLGFPTLIALHSVGMAVVVGLSLVISLRLFGFVQDVSADRLPQLLKVAAFGFALNFITGVALFITRGDEYIVSAMFLLKMALVLASAAILFWLGLTSQRGVLIASANGETSVVRRLSLLATLGWFAAVVAGRLIAYVGDLY